jgi:competence protein ComEC
MQMRNSFMAVAGLAALLAVAGLAPAAAQTRTTLDIYVADVEGGNATLFVSPSGASVLIDTGNFAPDAAIRDAERIAAAAKDARLTQIDHLITTHWRFTAPQSIPWQNPATPSRSRDSTGAS